MSRDLVCPKGETQAERKTTGGSGERGKVVSKKHKHSKHPKL